MFVLRNFLPPISRVIPSISTNLSSTRCLSQLELASFLLKSLLARDRQLSSDRLQDIFGQHSRPDSRILALRMCFFPTVSPEVLRLRSNSFRLSHLCRLNTIRYTGCQRSPFQFWMLPGLLIVESTGFLKHKSKIVQAVEALSTRIELRAELSKLGLRLDADAEQHVSVSQDMLRKLSTLEFTAAQKESYSKRYIITG